MPLIPIMRLNAGNGAAVAVVKLQVAILEHDGLGRRLRKVTAVVQASPVLRFTSQRLQSTKRDW